MAFVRRKGNQLAIVHGVRDSETQEVEQRTLFTLYSKAESLAAIGPRAHHFRQILSSENPGVRFDWQKIEKAIRLNLSHLPDLYTYKNERSEETFRSAVCDFARELMVNDPQTLVGSARLLKANRFELNYLRELIEWRLEHCEEEESEWNQDNPFFWRAQSNRREVPVEQLEELATLFAEGRYAETECLAHLIVECWPNFAEGLNYLGLVEMERERWQASLIHFDEAIRAGRTMFPKRIAKERYWSDPDTRPYIRAIIYKSQALNRLERYEEALALCDRLEKECHQDITGALERSAILLNACRWQEAIGSAKYVHRIYPQQCFHLALASFEAGERKDALVNFLHAAIKYPRTAIMVAGAGKLPRPTAPDEVEDHNIGVSVCRELSAFLGSRRTESKRFFKRIMESAEVKALIVRAEEARTKWRAERGADRTWFERMTEMESIEFARKEARRLESSESRKRSPGTRSMDARVSEDRS